ncbi:O-antigen polymerase [Stygiobacter electus]|uniref:O-antigen ligase n=1 Tax=Stygiobacter electus TaxID=3032292 RepID=A0AAE3TB32_9BACT|nr:O-antigen polymerase [Stygiobacter electus]MDF1610888.1 O-antigen ligase [Stygiobacter electus]
MSAVSITCFILFILILILGKRKDFFSPAKVFALVWLMTIGLTDLKLSRLQITWDGIAWFSLLLAIFSFLLGVYVVYVLFFDTNYLRIKDVRFSFTKAEIDENLLFKIIIVLFTLYSVSYFITYMIRGFVPIFTKMPEIARTKWGVFGIGSFVLTIPAILYLSLIYIFISKTNFARKLTIIFVMLTSFITYVFLLNRFYLLLPIALFLILLYYKTNKLRPRNILIILLVFSLIFFEISSLRLSRYAINILYYLSEMKFGKEYAIFTEPYMYISMNLENFANAVGKLDFFTYGYFVFDFVLKPIGLKDLISDYVYIKEFPNIINHAYNTYTMFFIYYRDFGFAGLFVIPLLFGSFVSYVYYKMRMNPTIYNISFYGMLIFVVAFSFFVPIIHWIHFVFNLILIYITTFLITCKKNIIAGK